MTKFYIDATGAFLGAYDGAPPPKGAVEVAAPPDDGRKIWDGAAWQDWPTKAADDAAAQLAASDDGEIRVLDDLIDVLISKGTITLADLPPAARAKFTTRKTARGKL